jgi:hypothetical protein
LKVAAVRAGVWRLVGLLASSYGQLDPVANMLLQLVVKFEHFSPHAVELLTALIVEYQQPAVIPALFKYVCLYRKRDIDPHLTPLQLQRSSRDE